MQIGIFAVEYVAYIACKWSQIESEEYNLLQTQIHEEPED